MQAVAGEIKAEGGFGPSDPNEDSNIGLLGVHIRASPGQLPELIHNGVLGFKGHKLRVVQGLVGVHCGPDGDAGVLGDVLIPVHELNTAVEFVLIEGLKTLDGHKHPVGQPRPQADSVGVFKGPFKGDPNAALHRRGDSKLHKLLDD